jgi:hypothetical protein
VRLGSGAEDEEKMEWERKKEKDRQSWNFIIIHT